MKKIPLFHDGLLMGVEIVGEEEVILRLKDVDERRFILRMTGVSSIQVNEFREGNIILDLRVSERLEEYRDVISRLVFWTDDVDDSKWSRYIEDALKDNKKLLTIYPSYGAEVFALCSEVELINQEPLHEEH